MNTKTHNPRASIPEAPVDDLTPGQQSGFRAGWNLATETPTDSFVAGVFDLVGKIGKDRGGVASSKLLGFLSYHQALIAKLETQPRPNGFRAWLRRYYRSSNHCG